MMPLCAGIEGGEGGKSCLLLLPLASVATAAKSVHPLLRPRRRVSVSLVLVLVLVSLPLLAPGWLETVVEMSGSRLLRQRM